MFLFYFVLLPFLTVMQFVAVFFFVFSAYVGSGLFEVRPLTGSLLPCLLASLSCSVYALVLAGERGNCYMLQLGSIYAAGGGLLTPTTSLSIMTLGECKFTGLGCYEWRLGLE